MPAEPVFLRWEHTRPPHYKAYEFEVELSLFFPKQVTRRWGRIGHRPRSLRVVVHTPAELAAQVQHVARRRQRHGYRTVSVLYRAVEAA